MRGKRKAGAPNVANCFTFFKYNSRGDNQLYACRILVKLGLTFLSLSTVIQPYHTAREQLKAGVELDKTRESVPQVRSKNRKEKKSGPTRRYNPASDNKQKPRCREGETDEP